LKHEISDVPEARHVHNAVFNFNETSTVNLSEIPVNQNQIHGRTLVNSYVTALALAKQKYQVAFVDIIMSAGLIFIFVRIQPEF
jgi:hypothetical protein